LRFGRHFLSRNISELDGKPVGKHRKSCSSTEFSRSQRVAEDSPRMMAAAGCLVRGSGGACKTGGMTLLSRDLAPSVLVRLGFAIYLIIKPAFLICSKVSKVIFSPSWSRERERERDIRTSLDFHFLVANLRGQQPLPLRFSAAEPPGRGTLHLEMPWEFWEVSARFRKMALM